LNDELNVEGMVWFNYLLKGLGITAESLSQGRDLILGPQECDQERYITTGLQCLVMKFGDGDNNCHYYYFIYSHLYVGYLQLHT
jgi:hypothetical protein